MKRWSASAGKGIGGGATFPGPTRGRRGTRSGEARGNGRAAVGLRGFGADGEAARAVLAALAEEAGDLADARAAVDVIARAVAAEDAEGEARAAVDRLALLAAVAALRQSAPEVADLFARTRLEEGHGAIYG